MRLRLLHLLMMVLVDVVLVLMEDRSGRHGTIGQWRLRPIHDDNDDDGDDDDVYSGDDDDDDNDE